MAIPDPIVAFERMELVLDGRQFLDGINMAVYPGERFLVFGPYGCGKSLFPRIILGLIRATAGRVLVLGRDVATLHRRELYDMRMGLGFVPRENHLIHNLSVFENIALPLAYHRRSTTTLLQNRVRSVIDFFNLGEYAALRPHQLQNLTAKKVALAQALVCRPRILLIDGPYAGMDVLVAQKLNRLYFEDTVRWWRENPLGDSDAAEERLAIFLSCSVLHRILDCVDRCAMLYDRRFVFTGTRDELKTTDNPYVRQFLDARGEGPIQYAGI